MGLFTGNDDPQTIANENAERMKQEAEEQTRQRQEAAQEELAKTAREAVKKRDEVGMPYITEEDLGWLSGKKKDENDK